MSDSIIGYIFGFAGVSVTAIGGFLAVIINKNVRLSNIEHNLDDVNEKLKEHNNYAKKFGEINDRIGSMETDMATMRNDIQWIKQALTEISKQR